MTIILDCLHILFPVKHTFITNCNLDPVPTRLLKEQLNCIIPRMVDIVNKWLCSGVFSDCLKQAIVEITGNKCLLQL